MDLIHHGQAIFDAGVRAVQADRVLNPVDWVTLLGDARSVTVVGAGKASMAMAGAVEPYLTEVLLTGLVVVPHGYQVTLPSSQRPPERIEVVEAAHPVPDEHGRRAAERVLEMAEALGEDDLLLVLLSGGGSALWPVPVDGISIDELRHVNERLLASGASIQEINAVRKHLSRIKGGRLAQAAHPARVETLLISDVVGDLISVIASGPTAPDPSTFRHAHHALRRYELWDAAPHSVQKHIEGGLRGKMPDTPKPGDPVFDRVQHHLLAGSQTALVGARHEAERLGYKARIIDAGITGEARNVGKVLVDRLLSERVAGRPVCLLWGGESTVTVSGSGKGGRNQEMALAAGIHLEGEQGDILFLSGGTDGIDGPTDAAGAWVTPQTAAEARAKGLDASAFLHENDSYHFFKKLGTLLRPGPTHTNVMDVHVGLVAPS